MRFRLPYEELNSEQKKEIRSELVCLFREEETYLLESLPI